jgi:hypothetical protein
LNGLRQFVELDNHDIPLVNPYCYISP